MALPFSVFCLSYGVSVSVSRRTDVTSIPASLAAIPLIQHGKNVVQEAAARTGLSLYLGATSAVFHFITTRGRALIASAAVHFIAYQTDTPVRKLRFEDDGSVYSLMEYVEGRDGPSGVVSRLCHLTESWQPSPPGAGNEVYREGKTFSSITTICRSTTSSSTPIR